MRVNIRHTYFIAIILLQFGCSGDSNILNEIFTSVKSCPTATSASSLLDAVNKSRSSGRMCGATYFPPAASLMWDWDLYRAAQDHSNDMANRNFYNHTGSDGSSPQDRTESAGYGRITSENIWAGTEIKSYQYALDGWLATPHHCANIMDAQVKDYSIACAFNDNSDEKIYFTQNFGLNK